jgi:hypothetical protein
MSKKQMTAEETLGKIRGILEYYMTEDTGYTSLLAISRGEWGMFNNDWEAEAFYTCQELIELLGLAEPHESEEEDGDEVYIEDEE